LTTNEIDKFWTEKQAARFLNRSPEALRAWRRKGTGPEFVTDPMGRIHYDKEKVREWIQNK